MCPQSQTAKRSSCPSLLHPPLVFLLSSSHPDDLYPAHQCCPEHKVCVCFFFLTTLLMTIVFFGSGWDHNSQTSIDSHTNMQLWSTSSSFLESCRRLRQYLIQHLAISAVFCLSCSLRSLSASPESDERRKPYYNIPEEMEGMIKMSRWSEWDKRWRMRKTKVKTRGEKWNFSCLLCYIVVSSLVFDNV